MNRFHKVFKIITLIICITLTSGLFSNTVIAATARNKVVRGIVENNNPQLGYITLYNEDGTGTNPDLQDYLTRFRTFNYGEKSSISVYKDHKKAELDDIEPGDSVFIRIDPEGNILSISGVHNYTVKYAKVISKRPASIAIDIEDGSQQVLDIDEDMWIFKDGKAVNYKDLKDGDRIKLVLHITNNFTKIKEIVIEDIEQIITNIYKGRISRIDNTSHKLVLQNPEQLLRGQWDRAEQKGFVNFQFSEEHIIYNDNEEITINDVNKYMISREAYVAVKRDYGDEELVAFLSIRDDMDSEMIFDDNIYSTSYGTSRLNLVKGEKIKVGDGSIIIKDGKLVKASSISKNDKAYVVANRKYGSGGYSAGVVQINDMVDNNSIQIYRGRIKDIIDNKEFTIESFSILDGFRWSYYNTPKTFRITYDTRILDDNGIVNQRDFIEYGEESYSNSVVYIIANEMDSVVVSTAPFGSKNIRGIIYKIDGGEIEEEGTLAGEPDKISIRDVKNYGINESFWIDGNNATIDLLKNSVILKDNSIIKPSDLRKGDHIRVLKPYGDDSMEGCIVIVEK